MHLSMSSPTSLPRGLIYFYRGFDSKYRPNPGDIDIFFQQSIALQFNLSISYILESNGLIVTCIRWRPFRMADGLLAYGQTPYRWVGEPLLVSGNIMQI